jgi:putative redox protein
MGAVIQKTIVTQKLEGKCVSHSRTDVAVRDVAVSLDEPLERGGTNQGLTPTETLMAALIGCTNVITHKVAHKNGVHIKSMNVRAEAQFDRRGVTLQEEIEVPFPCVTLYIELETDADAASLERVKRELAKFCPLAKVLRGAGTELREVWNVKKG